jgi:hypothetical protein
MLGDVATWRGSAGGLSTCAGPGPALSRARGVPGGASTFNCLGVELLSGRMVLVVPWVEEVMEPSRLWPVGEDASWLVGWPPWGEVVRIPHCGGVTFSQREGTV